MLLATSSSASPWPSRAVVLADLSPSLTNSTLLARWVSTLPPARERKSGDLPAERVAAEAQRSGRRILLGLVLESFGILLHVGILQIGYGFWLATVFTPGWLRSLRL